MQLRQLIPENLHCGCPNARSRHLASRARLIVFSAPFPVAKDGQPKKTSLRKFKRADLEVSDKIGKGAYGGVWQAS